MKTKYLNSLFILLLLITSCNNIPDDIQNRKQAINNKLDSINSKLNSQINLKTCTSLINFCKDINDSLIVLTNECSKRKIKIDISAEAKVLGQKRMELNKIKSDLLLKGPIGTWYVTLRTGEQFVLDLNNNHTWFSPRINAFAGSMEGTWQGTSESLYFTTFSNSVSFSGSVSEDGEYLNINLYGTTLMLKQK